MNMITHNTKPVFFEDFINNFFGSNIYNDIPPYNIIDTDKEANPPFRPRTAFGEGYIWSMDAKEGKVGCRIITYNANSIR